MAALKFYEHQQARDEGLRSVGEEPEKADRREETTREEREKCISARRVILIMGTHVGTLCSLIGHK